MALEGIKILDLSLTAPGQYCSMLLADMGADALKIEPPERVRRRAEGDLNSEAGVEPERARAHRALDRNKRSLVLDLKSPQGLEIFRRLCETADVVMEAYRPGVAARLGVDYQHVAALNPRIVYCSLSGYGQDGPYADLPAHDINCLSISGALGVIGIPGGPPVLPSNLLADMAGGGMHAALGIAIALVARDRTGRGQHVDASMLDGLLSLLTIEATWYFQSRRKPERGATHVTGYDADYRLYETKDAKWVAVGNHQTPTWAPMCEAMGLADLASRQREPAVAQRVQEVFRTRTRDEWFEILKDVHTCVTPVLEFDEAMQDPHVIHRGMVQTFDVEGVGQVRHAGISLKLSETPGRIRNLAPKRGQDTDEVLRGIGYDAAEVERLKASGVVA